MYVWWVFGGGAAAPGLRCGFAGSNSRSNQARSNGCSNGSGGSGGAPAPAAPAGVAFRNTSSVAKTRLETL